MTFMDFDKWCNDRACDGCWSMNTAIACINIVDKYNKIWFKWRREQIWNKSEDKIIAEQIVTEINQKIKKYRAQLRK